MIRVFPNGTREHFNSAGKLGSKGYEPAAVAPDGSRAWFRNGELHRETGPAYVGADGVVSYWLNGECLEQDDSGFDRMSAVRPKPEGGAPTAPCPHRTGPAPPQSVTQL